MFYIQLNPHQKMHNFENQIRILRILYNSTTKLFQHNPVYHHGKLVTYLNKGKFLAMIRPWQSLISELPELGLFYGILSASFQIQGHIPEEVAGGYATLFRSFLFSPEDSIKFLENLADHHVAKQNHQEAAQAFLMIAGVSLLCQEMVWEPDLLSFSCYSIQK